jgi:flagellar protein FliO/FliZ
MLLVLAGVVGVIYLLFVLLKRGARGRYPENQLIQLLDYQSLSSGRGLHLVDVGGRVYLVGSAENGVNLIAEITDQESLDTIKLQLAEKEPAVRKSFSSYLLDFFRAGEKREISVLESLGFMQKQKERIRKLRK